MLDKRAERELVLRLWIQGKSEDEIADMMEITVKQVQSYIYIKGSKEKTIQLMQTQGSSENRIALMMGIDVKKVHKYLEKS